MLSTITFEIAEQLDTTTWDVPSLLYELRLDTTDELPAPARVALDGDLAGTHDGPAWTVTGPAALPGHPFDALVGQQLASDAVGAALATEGWLRIDGSGIGELLGLAAKDGQVETRNVYAVLRDGTAAHVVTVRDGGTHLVPAAGTGRVPAALRRFVGAPSGLEPDSPTEVLARAWLHASFAAVAAATNAGAESFPMLGNTSVADATFDAAARSPQVLHHLLPAAYLWLLARVREQPTVSWPELLEQMAATGAAEHITWLLDAGSSAGHQVQHLNTADAHNVLAWCDGAMFGYLYHALIPEQGSLAAHHRDVAASVGTSYSWDALLALAHSIYT